MAPTKNNIKDTFFRSLMDICVQFSGFQQSNQNFEFWKFISFIAVAIKTFKWISNYAKVWNLFRSLSSKFNNLKVLVVTTFPTAEPELR